MKYFLQNEGKPFSGSGTDNDNDNDTLRKVQHPSMKAWPYRQECGGHDNAKKIWCTDEACSIGKVCTNPLLRTVCSASNLEMNSK